MDLLRHALLLEVKKKEESKIQSQTGTKEREKVNNLDDLLSGPKSKGSVAKPEPKETKDEPKGAGPKLKSAGAEKTRAKTAGVKIDTSKAPQFNPHEVDMSDEMSDEEAAVHAGHSTSSSTSHVTRTPGELEPKPVTPNTLPAVISKAMTTMGKNVANIDPEWHQIKHLPGYMVKAIRAVGRKTLAPFTSTPIEQIQTIACLQGSGPNTEAEVNGVAKYVVKHGTRRNVSKLYFEKVFPGYTVEVVMYDCDGITFQMVKDFAGHYIYAWPEKDTKDFTGTGPAKGLEHDKPALGHDKPQPKLIGHDKENPHSAVDDLMKKYGLD